MRPDELDRPVEQSAEKLVLDSYCTIVRLWADASPDIPRGRLEEAFGVTAASRQPVAQLTVETQVVRRRIVGRHEPATQNSCDDGPLPDGTPLTIVPLEEATFPDGDQTTDHRLPGGESIHPCSSCNATGHLDCRPCGQTGRVACSTCNGHKRLRCNGCSGTGRRILPNGVVANCPSCLASGSIMCGACAADGTVSCGSCGGRGYNTCGTCDGYTRVCRYHVLVSTVSTVTDKIFHYADQWPLDWDPLVKDMEPIWEEDVALEPSDVLGGIASIDADAYQPPVAARMVGRLHDALRAAVARGSVEDAEGTTATAVRFRIQGCYVHRVGYALDGRDVSDSIYIGGLRNRVAPGAIRERCRSSTAWIQRPFHSLLKAIGILESTGPSQRFKKRLGETGGRVHLLDTNAVVADAAESLGLTISVTDHGYALVGEQGQAVAEVDLTHDAKQQNLIVGFVAPLGEARRDQFVTALEFNAALTFGRVGVVMDDETGRLEFRLFDTRLYTDLTSEMYAAVLRYLIQAAMPKAAAGLGG
jgi:hypothetical protein